MIKIENTDVFGWDSAIRGMRNPMNSWDKSDSHWDLRSDKIERRKTCTSIKKNTYLILQM